MYQTFQGNTIYNSGLRYCTVSCQRMKFRLTDKQYCLPRLPKMFGKWKQFWVTMEFVVKRSSNKGGNSKARGETGHFILTQRRDFEIWFLWRTIPASWFVLKWGDHSHKNKISKFLSYFQKYTIQQYQITLFQWLNDVWSFPSECPTSVLVWRVIVCSNW